MIIPDDVMLEAVRAVGDMLFGPMSDDLRNAEIRAALAAALPILVPAIERNMIARIEPLIDFIYPPDYDDPRWEYCPDKPPSTSYETLLELVSAQSPSTEDEEKK
jgi:hypothetical protein